jgi:Mn2+/Fe2+ NRAMP family transporter
MTIEYALARAEVVRSFYESVKASPKYRMTIAIYALVIGVVVVIASGVLSHPTGTVVATKFLYGVVGYILFLPIVLFVRAKTSTRSLTISEAVISTKIGSLTGEVPWEVVRVIEAGDSFVLIGRTNGNAFFIPDRAFHSPEEKTRFLSSAKKWGGR